MTSAPRGLRSVIVEDEPLARATLRRFARSAGIEVLGEAVHGVEAVRLIDELRPSLLFLDVELPGFSGLEVLSRTNHASDVVFVTAYDSYAVSAFELGAIDYLVKPFGEERFRQALDRLQRLRPVEIPSASERARQVLGDGELPFLFPRVGNEVTPVAVETIRRFEARGDYVEVHADRFVGLLRVTLAQLERRLARQGRFFRVHRKHLVGLVHVARMKPDSDGRLLLLLTDGSEIRASRAGSQQLRELF